MAIFVAVGMKEMKEIYGSWCLLAGAAEGLGEAYALALAERGMDLILVDSQDELMQALGDRLENDFGISTRRICLDLARTESAGRIMEAMKDTSCRLMVYNAAFSRIRKFSDYTQEDLNRYVEVNARMPATLVHGLANLYKENPGQKKGIILMASMAGLWGSGLLAPYGATKAFNIVLAEALHYELLSRGFDVMACVAGPTSTPAYLLTRPRYGRIPIYVMTPGQVAEGALRSLGKRAFYIPGWRNRVNYFFLTRILPRRIAARLFNQATQKLYPEA
jgi:short-subunit dehydrogenase